VVDEACFEEALATTAMGRARTSALVSDRDRRITAWHEGGHTVLALVEEYADDPVTVTIVPRGGSGGTTWMSGNDHAFLTREQAVARLAVALGGRAGEEVALDGSYSQGAAGDLDAATRLATAMATEYGMTRLGLARRPHVGGELPADVLEVVNELLEQALDRARAQLREHRDLLGAVVDGLLDREALTKAELDGLHARFALVKC
jgi:cell division protease FtsH